MYLQFYVIFQIYLFKQEDHDDPVSLLYGIYWLKCIWCTKRVKSTDTGRPVFQKYGSTRKFTGRPVFLRVDPYICGSTCIFTGRPVFYESTCIYGSTRIFNTGRPVFYGSTRILNTGRPVNIRVDP